eukprot:COSAG03_NODE_184_length_10942_cov_103.227520_5_plen_102_part_00
MWQDWGSVAVHWSCHRVQWARPAAQRGTQAERHTDRETESYDTCVPICDATPVNDDIQLTPAEGVSADMAAETELLAPRSDVGTGSSTQPDGNESEPDMAI